MAHHNAQRKGVMVAPGASYSTRHMKKALTHGRDHEAHDRPGDLFRAH